MSTFPPKKGNSNSIKGPNSNPPQMNSTPFSTGTELSKSIAMKDAGIKLGPVNGKTVNLF